MLKEKNRYIYLQIKEQSRLASEFEHALIEKNALESMLKSVIDKNSRDSNKKTGFSKKSKKTKIYL